MSFFMKLGATKSETPAPVLPPDAPKSDPALAAAPVEGFAAVPPARRQTLEAEKAVVLGEDIHKGVKTTLLGRVEGDKMVVTNEVKAEKEAAEAILDGDLQKFDAAVARIEAEKKAEEPAPKKRGRPPGSKNKPKLSDMKVLNPVSEDRAKEIDAEIVADMEPEIRIKSVTVSKGFTVNLGSFNSVRFDVSVTGEGSDLELVYSTLMGEIEERLNAEAAKYESEVDQKNKTMKPANEVVCK